MAWAGSLPVLRPTTRGGSPSRRLRRGGYTKQQHFAHRPDMVRPSRRHGWRRGPPLFGGARPIGRQRLGPRHAKAGMGQAEIIIDMVQGHLLAYAVLVFAQRGDAPAQ